MDRVEHLHPALLQLAGEVGHRALGLGDGHAVAGDDHHQARVGELDRHVGGAGRAHRAARLSPAGQRGAAGSDAGEEHVADRAVHRLGHLPGQDRAGRADEHAGDDQRGVLQRDAGAGRGEAGERVQRGDDHRHVRAADGQHGEQAERAGAEQDQPEEQLGVAAGGDDHGEHDGSAEQDRVDRLGDREAALQGLLELEERDV